MLVELFAKDSATSAATFLASKAVSKAQRKELAQLAGMESAWIECDQAIAGNVADMAESLVTELYEPFWFYRASLRLEAGEVCRQLSNAQETQSLASHAQDDQAPRYLFEKHLATRRLDRNKRSGWWTAANGVKKHPWLPEACGSFDAVVHFVQAGSGTGVHIGGGRVLTCAHVVATRDDEVLFPHIPDLWPSA